MVAIFWPVLTGPGGHGPLGPSRSASGDVPEVFDQPIKYFLFEGSNQMTDIRTFQLKHKKYIQIVLELEHCVTQEKT